MTVIPVYNMLLIPDAYVYLKADMYRALSGKLPEVQERVILLAVKEPQRRKDMTEDSFYPVGVAGHVTEINENGFAVIRTGARVNIDMVYVNIDHSIELTVSPRKEIQDLDPAREHEHAERLREEILRNVEKYEWGHQASAFIEGLATVNEMAGAIAIWVRQDAAERYAILEEDSRSARMEALEKLVYDFLTASRTANEAAGAQQKDYQQMYREQAIRRQMKILQQELDEMHPENVTDVQRFEQKIEAAGMNETALAEARKVVNRLKQEQNGSMETGMLYDYLDFVTSLSWKKEPAQTIDLTEAEEILEADHFGLEKVKKRILQQIAVMNLKRQQSGSILLFVGAPGTGKTSIGQSIAKALHRPYVRVSLGGVRDEADIRGHRRTYVGAMPGRIMDGIKRSGASNPVMVLDEVDKLGVSYNGDPASALLEVLDPEQNSTFTDHYMNVPYDLSDVLFICTANSVDTIPEPLLNRMEMIPFQGYTATDKFQIARRHLLPKARIAMGIGPDTLEVTDEAIRTIIADYTMESGVRGLRKCMDTLCRQAAVEIAKGTAAAGAGAAADEAAADGAAADGAAGDGTAADGAAGTSAGDSVGGAAAAAPAPIVTITPENVRKYLDTKPIRHDHVLTDPAPGIVTGLAWTRAGGDILYIETLLTRGSGKITVTGQLGDVMKESVQIAVSLVKSMFPEEAQVLKDSDLHIHVPAGAVPKDGPSAGITMTTALASLVTSRSVDPHTAMTGEVSLRGAVTPIGGLPEKLMAARRAGITRVFIPDQNREDLEDIAPEVLEGLEIVPVRKVREVLTATGIL